MVWLWHVQRCNIIFIESIFFIEYKYRVYDIATFYMSYVTVFIVT